MDWIQGDRFMEIADFTYAPTQRHADDYCKLQNTFDFSIFSKLKPVNVIYTHTFYVKQLFRELTILQEVVVSPVSFIVITHNSDLNVDDSFEIPDNVIKWFAQNVITKNPKVHPIPIGIENDRWGSKEQKKLKMTYILSTKKHIENWVYINHNEKTNPQTRAGIYKLFEDKKWATVVKGKNGVDFGAYLYDLYHHLFTICPEGNGIDTHRIWECLYIGSFPVVKRSRNTSAFEGLFPIIFVDSWEEVTLSFLSDNFPRLVKEREHKEALEFAYWKDKIIQS